MSLGKQGGGRVGQGTRDTAALLTAMKTECDSCGKCVRPCAFLRQNGAPAAMARKGAAAGNLLTAYGCSLCGLCDALCPIGLSPSSMFLAMRREAVARGVADLKAYAPWLHYEKTGASLLFRRDLIPADCATVLFPGCSLAGARPHAVRELFRRLRRIEPTAGLVLDCCGKISHDLGLEDRFEAIFSKLSARLKSKGISRILTACPGCTKIARTHGNSFEVTSIYEVLAFAPLPPVPVTSVTVAIHDPCPSRFDLNHQQAVRALIKASGYGIRELPSHGGTTRCCGQGGMVEGCVPGSVKRESCVIADEAAGCPIVSSCATCRETLSTVASTAHVADVLAGSPDFSARPVSSLTRWLNRLTLRFARFR